MGIQDQVGWAFAQEVTPTEKLALVAVAFCCDAQGVTFAGQRKIAAMVGVGERAIRPTLARLGAKGMITRYRRRRVDGSRTSDLTVLAIPRASLDLTVYSGVVGDRDPGDAELATGGERPVANRKSDVIATGGGLPGIYPPVEPPASSDSLRSSGVKRAQAAIDRISGRPIEAKVWKRTEKALADFNELANCGLGARTGDGKPSETAKMIYLRLRAWPNLTEERVREVIKGTLESGWWDGPPQIGVVFSPKMWERNVAGQWSPPKNAKGAEREARRKHGLEAIARLRGAA